MLIAATAQIAYGISYVLFTISDSMKYDIDDAQSISKYYRKSVVINLFGLIGTEILLGLYAYAVTFPPLSPTNQPEDIDISGMLDKSIEVITFVGIIVLMQLESCEHYKILHVYQK